MATTESFDSINTIAQCPIGDIELECPTLARDLGIAKESSGEVFVGDAIRDRDNSDQRVFYLMQGAVSYVRKHPCEGCPNVTTKEP